MTVVWHVDDLKVSHVDDKEMDKFVMQMEETFGTDAPCQCPVVRYMTIWG